MASPPVLIDTSIFIEHLRKQDKTKSILYKVVDSYVLHTSTVVEFELYAGATSEQKQQDVGLVLMHSTIMPLTSDVAQQAARLYRHKSRQSVDRNARHSDCGYGAGIWIAFDDVQRQTL